LEAKQLEVDAETVGDTPPKKNSGDALGDVMGCCEILCAIVG